GEQVAARPEHAWGSGAADELVRRDEDRVEVRHAWARGRRAHLDLHVGRRGCEIPERERAVAVEQNRDRAPVADDPGHVGGGREAADLERAVLVADKLLFQLLLIDVAVMVLMDHDHLRYRLAP